MRSAQAQIKAQKSPQCPRFGHGGAEDPLHGHMQRVAKEIKYER